VELISVEQQEDLVHRVSLPNPCSYAHGFREKVGRRAKAQGAHRVFALLAATRCSAVCHSSVRVLSCSVTWLYYFPCEEVLIRGPFLTTTDVFYIWRNIDDFISG